MLITQQLQYTLLIIIHTTTTPYYRTYTGKSPAEYAKWIQNTSIWGGGIEIAVLAKHFHTGEHKYMQVPRF